MALISLRFFQRTCRKGLNVQTAAFQGFRHNSEYSLSEIRDEFQNYKGGQVTLFKNEDSGLAEICLSHPEKMNAMSGEMMVQLADIVTHLEKWETGKGVIVHASPASSRKHTYHIFCSGADLSMVQQICNPEGGMRMSILMHDTLTRLLALPLISVALVKGKAIGGGAELLTACDFRLVTSDAEIQFVQARMGVVTGWGGGTRLVHLLGQSAALELLTSCRRVFAQEAITMGLANELLTSREDLMVQSRAWLRVRTEYGTDVARAMKKIVVGATKLPQNQSLAEERKSFSELWGGPLQKEALTRNIK